MARQNRDHRETSIASIMPVDSPISRENHSHTPARAQTPVRPSEVLMIVWAPQQRRASNMCQTLGFHLRFVNGIRRTGRLKFTARLWKCVEYVTKFVETIAICIARRPRLCIVQNPPFFAIYAAWIGMLLSFRKPRLIADCHNAVFRPPWSRMTGAHFCLKLCQSILVHNEDIFQMLPRIGFNVPHALVLETRPTCVAPDDNSRQFESPVLQSIFAKKDHKTLIAPLAWKDDEPIEELVKLGAELPDFQILLTGMKGLRSHLRQNAPPNVIFTGFLSASDYELAMLRSTLVVGVTTIDGIQMSVANEAVGMGRPMVLSGTNTTRKLFYKGAVYTQGHTAKDFSNAVKQALDSLTTLSADAISLREERLHRWDLQADRFLQMANIQTRNVSSVLTTRNK